MGRTREEAVLDSERLVAWHREMLQDERRNRAFARALRTVRPRGAVVLDIGAGTGIWAVTAAVLGARRVVAIERDPRLAPVIEALCVENGVSDRVEVVIGDSRDLDLGRAFDVVVSETVGNLGIEEDIASIFSDARKRYLKRGGRQIPRSLTLVAAPTLTKPFCSTLALESFRALAANVPTMAMSDAPVLAAPRARLLHVDLSRSGPQVPLENLSARWRLRGASVDAVAAWVEMVLAPGVAYSTRVPGSWKPALFGIDPIRRGHGVLEFRLNLAQPRSLWQASFPAWEGPRQYSPLFALGLLGEPKAPGRRR
jgi:type III protein arginine methyltransferase